MLWIKYIELTSQSLLNFINLYHHAFASTIIAVQVQIWKRRCTQGLSLWQYKVCDFWIFLNKHQLYGIRKFFVSNGYKKKKMVCQRISWKHSTLMSWLHTSRLIQGYRHRLQCCSIAFRLFFSGTYKRVPKNAAITHKKVRTR